MSSPFVPYMDICHSFVDQANKYTAVPFIVLGTLTVLAVLVVLPLVAMLPLGRVPVVGKIQAFIVAVIRFFDLRLGVVNVGSVGAASTGAGGRGLYASLDKAQVGEGSASAGGADAGDDGLGFTQYGLGLESSRTVGGVLSLLFGLFSLLFWIFLNSYYNSAVNAQFTEQRRDILGSYPNTTKWQFELYFKCAAGSQFTCDTVNMHGMMHAMQRWPTDPTKPWDLIDVPFKKTCEKLQFHNDDVCHATFVTDGGLDKLNNIDHAWHWFEAFADKYAPLDATSKDFVFFGIKDLTQTFDSDLDPMVYSRSCRHWPMPAGQPNWIHMTGGLRAKCMGRGFGTMHFCNFDSLAYDFAERSEPAQAGKDRNELRIFMSLTGTTTQTIIARKDVVTIGTYLAAFVTILIVLHPYIKRTICDVFAACLKRWHFGEAVTVRQALQLIVMSTFYVVFFSFLGVHVFTELFQAEASLPTYQVDSMYGWMRLFGARIALTVLAVLFCAAFLVAFSLFAFLFLARSSSGKFTMSRHDEGNVNASAPAATSEDADVYGGGEQ